MAIIIDINHKLRPRLQARMAELAKEHQANVEARARVIRGDDWSELPALREQADAIGVEIKTVYETLKAA